MGKGNTSKNLLDCSIKYTPEKVQGYERGSLFLAHL